MPAWRLSACFLAFAAYNTHTVVYGAKHIMVAPPDSFDKVYFHPAVHPSHRQSQIINMTHPDLAHFPRAKDMGASETVLRPVRAYHVLLYHLLHTCIQPLYVYSQDSMLSQWPSACGCAGRDHLHPSLLATLSALYHDHHRGIDLDRISRGQAR